MQPRKRQATEPKAQSCGSRGLSRCPDGYECSRRPGAPCGPETDCPGECNQIAIVSPVPEDRGNKQGNSSSTGRPAPTWPPVGPAKTACTTDSSCPEGQRCSAQILDGSQTPGECVGAVCMLQGPEPRVCPGDQNCVQVPRQDGLVIFDLPGFCAARSMQCKSNSDCPGSGWVCQTRPNGGGMLCPKTVIGECGLCAFIKARSTPVGTY